jgi:hypothetical protein
MRLEGRSVWKDICPVKLICVIQRRRQTTEQLTIFPVPFPLPVDEGICPGSINKDIIKSEAEVPPL